MKNLYIIIMFSLLELPLIDVSEKFSPVLFSSNFKVYNPNQGSHRLEKYLNIQDCLEKSLNIKFA